jgi:hypothetical protein
MTFEEIVDQAMAMLQRRGRVTYRMVQRQFNLDDAALADLKNEIIIAQQLAIDENNTVLVWIGGTGTSPPTPEFASDESTSAVPPSPASAPDPLSYTPNHLAEKILQSKASLEGERKQVTVLFCDLADSIAIAERLGAESMRVCMKCV